MGLVPDQLSLPSPPSAPPAAQSCPLLIVITTFDLRGAILFTATLSFLGLGAQPPTPEWGAMPNAGREYVRYAPWTMIFPGLALFLTVMAVNLVGDRLRLVLDPWQNGRDGS
jgi:ABC-type dipeptide/oligopeptide/nickel transport system permease subunit